jgi:glycine hydroxymethyltransferase
MMHSTFRIAVKAGRRAALTGTRVRRITTETRNWAVALNEPLSTTDPELYALIEQEKKRQKESLVLIASENFTSK